MAEGLLHERGRVYLWAVERPGPDRTSAPRLRTTLRKGRDVDSERSVSLCYCGPWPTLWCPGEDVGNSCRLRETIQLRLETQPCSRDSTQPESPTSQVRELAPNSIVFAPGYHLGEAYQRAASTRPRHVPTRALKRTDGCASEQDLAHVAGENISAAVTLPPRRRGAALESLQGSRTAPSPGRSLQSSLTWVKKRA